jgi:hypothetical protein
MIEAQQIHLAPEAYTGFHVWRGTLKIVGQDHFSTSNVLNVAGLNYVTFKWKSKYALVKKKGEILKNYY